MGVEQTYFLNTAAQDGTVSLPKSKKEVFLQLGKSFKEKAVNLFSFHSKTETEHANLSKLENKKITQQNPQEEIQRYEEAQKKLVNANSYAEIKRIIIDDLKLSSLDINLAKKFCFEVLDLPCGKIAAIVLVHYFADLKMSRALPDHRIDLFEKILERVGQNSELCESLMAFLSPDIPLVPITQRLRLFSTLISLGQETAVIALSNIECFGLKEASLEERIRLCMQIADVKGKPCRKLLSKFDQVFGSGEMTREQRLELCLSITKKEESAIEMLFDNFDKLGLGNSKEQRLTLFTKFLEQGESEACAAARHIDKLELTPEKSFEFALKIVEKGPSSAQALANNLGKFRFENIPSEQCFQLYQKIAGQGALASDALIINFHRLGLEKSEQRLKLCKQILNYGSEITENLAIYLERINLEKKDLLCFLGSIVAKGLQGYFTTETVFDSMSDPSIKRQFLIDLLSPPSGLKGSLDLAPFSSFTDEIKPIIAILDKSVNQISENEINNLKTFIKQNPKMKTLELEIENIERNIASKIEMDLKADLEKSVGNRRGEAGIRKDAEFIRQGFMGWAAYAAGILYDLPENQIALLNQKIDQGVRKDLKFLDIGPIEKSSYRYTLTPKGSLLTHSIHKQYSIDILSSPSKLKVTDEVDPLLTILNKPVEQISENDITNLKLFIQQNPKLEILDLEIKNIEINLTSKIKNSIENNAKRKVAHRRDEASILKEVESIKQEIMRWAANTACILCDLPENQIVLLNQEIARGEDPTSPTILDSIASYGKPSLRYTFMRQFSLLAQSSAPLEGFDPKWKDSTYMLAALTNFGMTKEKQIELCVQIEKNKYMKDTEYNSTLAQLLLMLEVNGPYEPQEANSIAQCIIDALKPSALPQTKTEMETKEGEEKLAQSKAKKGGESAEKYRVKKELVTLTNILQIFGREEMILFAASPNRDGAVFFQANVEKFFTIKPSEGSTANVSTVASDFQETFGRFRDPMALFTYYRAVTRFPSEQKAAVKNILNVFVNSVIQRNFHAVRYNPSNSEHLQKVFADPQIKDLWCKSSPPRPFFLSKQISEADVKESRELSGSQYEIMESDDPCDLLLIGTEGKKSCQSIHNMDSSNNNKALPSYLMNGEVKMIAIKREGMIVARAAIRLLWDEANQRPVILQEKIYSNLPDESIQEAIDDWAKEKAKAMGVYLVVGETNEGERYNEAVEGLQGFAPYIYSDAFGGIQDGPYISNELYIRYKPDSV